MSVNNNNLGKSKEVEVESQALPVTNERPQLALPAADSHSSLMEFVRQSLLQSEAIAQVRIQGVDKAVLEMKENCNGLLKKEEQRRELARLVTKATEDKAVLAEENSQLRALLTEAKSCIRPQ